MYVKYINKKTYLTSLNKIIFFKKRPLNLTLSVIRNRLLHNNRSNFLYLSNKYSFNKSITI